MRMIRLLAGSAVFVMASLSAHAAPASRCLREDNIDSFDAPNDSTLIVRDNFHNKFKITFLGSCTGIGFKEGLAFKSFGGTRLSCLSAGDSVYERNVGTGRMECPIRSVVPYTPAMEQADIDAKAAAKATQTR